jgi:predicted DNA-binding transcriptional regulator AlpA
MVTAKPAVLDTAHLLTEVEAAQFLNVSHRSLQNWRVRGGGPRYVKIGGRIVRYRRSDLAAWIDGGCRSNTSERVA